MIKSIRHKGLKQLYERGDGSRLPPQQLKRIRAVLTRLAGAETIEDMNFSGSRLHPLKGELQGFWSVSVSGNYRIIFRFYDGNVHDVDYLDYH